MSSDHIHVYHYASQQYDVLKTRKAQGLQEPTEMGSGSSQTNREIRPGVYTEHVSFFVEPIPLEIMGHIYGKDHPVWHSGSELFEHKVDMGKVKSFMYHFVETPEKIAMLFDDGIDDKEYYKRLDKVNAEKGYVGSGLSEFSHPYKQFQGQTKRHILRADSFPRWQESRLKYAACVPHVMVYPKGGLIPVESSRKVTVV